MSRCLWLTTRRAYLFCCLAFLTNTHTHIAFCSVSFSIPSLALSLLLHAHISIRLPSANFYKYLLNVEIPFVLDNTTKSDRQMNKQTSERASEWVSERTNERTKKSSNDKNSKRFPFTYLLCVNSAQLICVLRCENAHVKLDIVYSYHTTTNI